ncbi:hypothetical protein JST56_05285 [Candidatus Dependentiae bacterium]|nr:hypothetical protein [Candidatus Dependentiae bacterium]
MKVIFRLLIVNFLLSGSVAIASDEHQKNSTIVRSSEDSEYPSSTSWYDKADQVLEEFTGISTSLYADAAVYHQWAGMLSDLTHQLTVQEQMQFQFLQQVQFALEASIQKIKELEARRPEELMQARQEQFEIDGHKASELIAMLENLKKEFACIVIPEREALFTQLQRFSDSLKGYMQQGAQQALQVIQTLQSHVEVVGALSTPVALAATAPAA